MAEKDKEILKQLNKKSDYQVKLDSFEGPLDLLLHLIKEAKIDIKDIFISHITEQYLAYLDEIETLDLEKAGEFIELAAQLLEIKARSLLPRIEEMMPEADDPRRKLIQQLEEYKLFKEASEKLKPLESVDRFYKIPDESVGDPRTVLKDMTLDGLLDAFSRLLTKAELKRGSVKSRSIILDRFTVAEKIIQIREIIEMRRELSFSELFDADYSKSEIINTFLALLELLKMQFIKVVQPEAFCDIMLYHADDMPVEQEANN